MFRITEDPSSGSILQCLAKNYKNGSIVSVDMDRCVLWQHILRVCVQFTVCVVPSYTVNYTHTHTHTHTVTTCCHNTDPVHVNGHDRIILVIFSQALYSGSLTMESSVIRNILENFSIFYNSNCIYILCIVHWLDNDVFQTQRN